MPRTRAQVGGVQQTIRRVKGMADLRVFKRIRVMVSGVMQTVFQYLTVAASPISVFGSSSSPGPTSTVTAPTSVFVTGGTAPFTYLWTEVEAFGGTWTITNPTGAVTTFSITLDAGESGTATFINQVTDADGNVVFTNTVAASAVNFG